MEAKDPIVEELKYLKLQASLAEKQAQEVIALRESSKNKNDYDDLLESFEKLHLYYMGEIRRILNGQF